MSAGTRPQSSGLEIITYEKTIPMIKPISASATKNSDLNTAVEKGGTPADLGNAYALQIQAYAEAPWSSNFGEQNAMKLTDLISEAYSTTLGCVNDWNSSVKAYNKERSRISGLVDSGRIVGDAANALGIDKMPLKLPYYESPSSSQPVGTDFLPTAVPNP